MKPPLDRTDPRSRRAARLALTLIVLLAACSTSSREADAPGPAATAAPSTPEWRLAYNVWTDPEADDYDVFVMDLDGGGRRNLTGHPAVDWVYRAWGERLVLVSDRDQDKRQFHLYEMTLAEPTPRRITRFHVRDSWIGFRAGGEQIAVSSSQDGHADLYLIDRDGRELRRLTADEHYDNDPAISPDGRWLVWRSRRSGLDELWLMDLDADDPLAGARQITHFPEEGPVRGYHAGPPVWVPGEDRISFCSKRGGDHSIYSVRPDGSDLQRLTGDGTDEIWHDWSPDGRYLAWDQSDPEGGYDIWLRDLETGEDRRLTDGPEVEQAPAFVEAG